MDYRRLLALLGSDCSHNYCLLYAPLQRPSKQLVDTIEYNLEQLDDLSIEELELLKETTDSLIEHVEHLKAMQAK